MQSRHSKTFNLSSFYYMYYVTWNDFLYWDAEEKRFRMKRIMTIWKVDGSTAKPVEITENILKPTEVWYHG